MRYSCVFCTWMGEHHECVEDEIDHIVVNAACPVCGSECQPLFEVAP